MNGPVRLYILAPNRRVAETCLWVDHGIDPRHPAIRFIGSVDMLRGAPHDAPVWLIDPLCVLGQASEVLFRHFMKSGRVRDWTEAERAFVRKAAP